MVWDLGLGTWLLPFFLSETGSQPDRQASSPPQSDELPIRRCCFLCRIRAKIKSFHGAAISEQQEFDAPDFQVSLFSLRIYLFPPNLCGKCRWICMWFEQRRAGLRKSFVRKIMHVVIGIFSLVLVTNSSTLDSFFILARLLHFRPSALSELLSELSTSGSKRAFDRLLNHQKKIKQSIESSESSCLISFCAFKMIRFLSTLICVTATTLLQVAARYLRMMEIKCISFMLFKPCMFPKQ